MKNEVSVYNTYRMFEKDTLPLLNFIEDQEKEIISRRTFLNKAKCHQEVVGLYEKYRAVVRKSWEMIYSSDAEFNKTFMNIEVLLQGESLCAENNVQRFVEQFFLWLSMSLTYVIMMYKGEEEEAVAIEESNNARYQMHNMMARIDEEEPRILKSCIEGKTVGKEEKQIVESSAISIEEIKNKLDTLFKRMREIELDYEKYAEVENSDVDFGNYRDKWTVLVKEAKSQLTAIRMYVNSYIQQSKNNEPLGFDSLHKLGEISNALDLFIDYADRMRKLMMHLDQKAHGKAYSKDDYLKELKSTINKRKRFVSEYNNNEYVLPKQPIENTTTKSNMIGLSDDPLEYFTKNHDDKSIHQDILANISSVPTKTALKDNSVKKLLIIVVAIIVFFNAIAFVPGKKPYIGSSQKIYATSYEGYDYLLIFNSSNNKMAICQYREDPETVSGFYGIRTHYTYDATCFNRIGPISICPQLSLFFWNNIIIGQNDTAAKIHFTAFRNDFLECKNDAVSGSFDELLIDHGYGIELGKLYFTEITDSVEQKHAIGVWNAFGKYAVQRP